MYFPSFPTSTCDEALKLNSNAAFYEIFSDLFPKKFGFSLWIYTTFIGSLARSRFRRGYQEVMPSSRNAFGLSPLNLKILLPPLDVSTSKTAYLLLGTSPWTSLVCVYVCDRMAFGLTQTCSFWVLLLFYTPESWVSCGPKWPLPMIPCIVQEATWRGNNLGLNSDTATFELHEFGPICLPVKGT